MEVGNKVDVTDPGGGVERGKGERGEGLVCVCACVCTIMRPVHLLSLVTAMTDPPSFNSCVTTYSE